MATAKRPSRPRPKQKIGKLIEELPCLADVDRMLLENIPVATVAAFIKDDRGLLTDVNAESLANGLSVRRRQRQGTDDWWGASPEETDEELLAQINYRRVPVTPGKRSKDLYTRTEGGIIDMIELEASFLAKQDRVDRLLELEAATGAFSDITTRAMDSMDEVLWKRIQARAKMNEGKSGEGDVSLHLSIRNYSQQTVDVLSKPESRHRIMSLLERLTRFGKSGSPLPLPLPQSTEK